MTQVVNQGDVSTTTTRARGTHSECSRYYTVVYCTVLLQQHAML